MNDWEGGIRPTMRRLWVAAAVAAAAVAVAVMAARPSGRLSVEPTDAPPTGDVTEAALVLAPLRTADGWRCPAASGVRAAGSVYYPAGYPVTAAADVRPEGCYETAAQAAAAGYRRPPTPAGSVLVEGIYLERVRTDDCARAARAAGFAVPCPARLPVPAGTSLCREACVFEERGGPHPRRSTRDAGVVFQHRDFFVPPEPPWLGMGRDVVLTALPVTRRGAGGAVQVAGPREFVSCFPEGELVPQGRSVVRVCVDAKPFVPGAGGYPLQRHSAAIWQRGDVVYAAGVEGSGDHVTALLEAIIAGIRYVAPPER